MCLTGDGSLVVGGKSAIKVVNVGSGKVTLTLEGHSGDVNALCSMGTTLFSGADAKGANREHLKSWDLTTGAPLKTFEGHRNAVWSLVAVNGLLYSGGEDGTIRIWDPATAECKQVLEGHEGKVRSLQYVEAEGRLYSGGHDGKVIVWDVATGEQVKIFSQQSGWITAVLVTAELVCVASVDKTVGVFAKASGEKKATLAQESWASSLAFYDGVLFVGVGDATVCAWNPLTGELLFKTQGHMAHHAVSALLVTEGTLYTAAWDGVAHQWDIATLQEKVANFVPEPVVETVVIEKSAEAAVENNASIFDETDCELLD